MIQKPVGPDRSFAELFVRHCTKNVERSGLCPQPHRASHTASNPDAGLANRKLLRNKEDSDLKLKEHRR